MKRLLIPLFCLLSVAFATTYEELDLETIIERAEIVFYGSVATITVEEREGAPWTVVTFTVTQTLRGEALPSRTLSFYGGNNPTGVSLLVTGMPTFRVGEEVLIMAYDAPYYSPIVGFSQGLWRLGSQGLRDEAGRILSFDEEGVVIFEGTGAGTEDLLRALTTLFGRNP